jgi:hypothetical protein
VSASVSVVNIQSVVVVRNAANGSTVVVQPSTSSTASISNMGVRGPEGVQGPQGPEGPQGPAGSIEAGFIIDGGNF